jgi:hypothetical protein
MSFQNLAKGSVLYIEAIDPFAINTANNTFNYKGETITPPGNVYPAYDALTKTWPIPYEHRADLKFRRVTEHNRDPLAITTNRIESSQRMSNGTLRKYFIADKLNISASWEMLPSFRNETVDGGWGAEDIKNFYESDAGRGSFRIKLNPTVFNPSLITADAGTLADDYTYTVMFTSCDFTVLKRGLQTFWSVSISMEQV